MLLWISKGVFWFCVCLWIGVAVSLGILLAIVCAVFGGTKLGGEFLDKIDAFWQRRPPKTTRKSAG